MDKILIDRRNETATVLSYKYSQEEAKKFLDFIFSSDVHILYMNEYLTAKSVIEFMKYSKKHISFIDCSNLILMEEYGLDTIFSFDKFYKDKLFKF